MNKIKALKGVKNERLLKKGNNIINSTSKIIKTKAIKKKWRLNFNRWSLKVENPHSKGLWNSRSKNVFLLTNLPKIRKITEKILYKKIIIKK